MSSKPLTIATFVVAYLAQMVAQGAISHIGEGITEQAAQVLRHLTPTHPNADGQLDTFLEEPGDEHNCQRLVRFLDEQIAGNAASRDALDTFLQVARQVYPCVTYVTIRNDQFPIDDDTVTARPNGTSIVQGNGDGQNSEQIFGGAVQQFFDTDNCSPHVCGERDR